MALPWSPGTEGVALRVSTDRVTTEVTGDVGFDAAGSQLGPAVLTDDGATASAVAPADGASRSANPPTRGWRNLSRRTRVAVLILAYTLTFVIVSKEFGFPTSRSRVFLWIIVGLIAGSASSPNAIQRIVVDWLPLFVVLVAYDLLRGQADGLVARAHLTPQLHADEWLGGGVAPTVRLQHALYHFGHPHLWDYLAFFVYLSHFFVPILAAALLWKFDYRRFHRYAGLFVGLTFLAYFTYALYPAVPPWLASQQGALEPTVRVIQQMWGHVGMHSAATAFETGSRVSNPVAAIPSLHAAYPFLLLLFFWRTAGRWRWALVAYVLAMGFTLVYTGEHYVVDILLGWLYAVIAYVGGMRIADWWTLRRARTSMRTEPISLDEPVVAGAVSDTD
jgi:membrane-associated phospholipid phosphatase